MANGGAPVRGGDEDAQVITAAISNNNDLHLIRDAVSSLPLKLLQDLLSNGVCTCCVFRLFSLHEQIFSHPCVETRILRAILHGLAEHEGDGANSCVREAKDSIDVECLEVCRVCRGILQFMYRDDKGVLVKKNHASDFAAEIGDAMKQEGHQIDGFSLEASLPPTVVENEQAVRSYIIKKYSTEPLFTEKFPSESISMKDFLKLSVARPLEKLLDVKSNESSFRIRLTYALSDASAKDQPIHDKNGCYKRRKIDDADVMENCTDLQKVEGIQLSRNSLTECQDDIGLSFPLEKVDQCCSLVLQFYKTSVYVGGRYLKYSRNVSQSRWIIDDERMGEASVEEIVGGNILPICQGDSYKFHAAGREDIDVRMLGTGRPFLVEIQNARKFPSDVLIKEIEKKINNLESKFVRVKNLKFLGSQGWDLMREGEAEKQKQYTALVWISRPLTNDDSQKLSSLKDMDIVRCPFLRNINEPTNFSFSKAMASPVPIREGKKGPIFEDGPNFDSAFKLFHGKNGVVPLSETSFVHPEKSSSDSSRAQFNPLAARAATISLSGFGLGGPFGFDAFSKKWNKGKKKSNPEEGKSGHEAMSNEWLQNGNCPIAKSYRAVNHVLPLVAKAIKPPPGVKFTCPPAVIAARAAISKTAFAKNLRPQPLPAKIIVIGMLGMAANIPLGIWREHTKKFSPSWFVAVHAAVPFIGMLRKSILMPKAAMAFTIAASILGQVIGSRAERHRIKTLDTRKMVLNETSTNVPVQLAHGGHCSEAADWKPNSLQVASSSADVFC